ncbi:MAG: glycosyltransferase family 8 protein [Stenomitos rutilans HA7619-LM2]|jgi:lipopolysaccharide biosynthesis glycosyltransferase|nr:glycosyltransferase family 8 protein [Stenomitos rutilans HA7619-LM2]
MFGFLTNYRLLQAELIKLEQSKTELKALPMHGKQLEKVERKIAIVKAKMSALYTEARSLGLEASVEVLSPQGNEASRFDDSIALVCSADEPYAMPMTAMLCSVLANLKTNAPLLISVIDGGIRSATKQKVLRSLQAQKVPFRLNWLKPDLTLLQGLPLSYRYTLAAYYRLLIPEALPTHLNKVIYLDCDMIVQGNLAELWQLELDDYYALAVQDDYQPLVSSRGGCGLRNYQALGLNPEQPYFNSGLLIINLKKWREEAIGRQVLEFSRQNWMYIQNADQDGLNAVFRGNWGRLDERWNQMPQIYTYASWQESPYDAIAFQSLRETPHIVHYTNAPKPWQHQCDHPAKALFFAYLDQTAWKGWRDTLLRRVVRKIRKSLSASKKRLNPIAALTAEVRSQE